MKKTTLLEYALLVTYGLETFVKLKTLKRTGDTARLEDKKKEEGAKGICFWVRDEGNKRVAAWQHNYKIAKPNFET